MPDNLRAVVYLGVARASDVALIPEWLLICGVTLISELPIEQLIKNITSISKPSKMNPFFISILQSNISSLNDHLCAFHQHIYTRLRLIVRYLNQVHFFIINFKGIQGKPVQIGYRS